MKTTAVIIVLGVLCLWLFAKWIKSRTLRKVERDGNERAADDVRAVIAIAEKINEMPKGSAANELDAMRKRLSGNDSSGS